MDDSASKNNDVIYSEDSLLDTESISLEGNVPSPTGDTSWCFEDDIVSGNICLCGALGRAHKKDCPLNSRNLYVGYTLFPKASSAECDKDSCIKSKPKTSKSVDTGSTHLGKREKPSSEKPPLT